MPSMVRSSTSSIVSPICTRRSVSPVRAIPGAVRTPAASAAAANRSREIIGYFLTAGTALVSVLLLYVFVSWQVFAHEPPLGSFVNPTFSIQPFGP